MVISDHDLSMLAARLIARRVPVSTPVAREQFKVGTENEPLDARADLVGLA
jgi:hypothetical protein